MQNFKGVRVTFSALALVIGASGFLQVTTSSPARAAIAAAPSFGCSAPPVTPGEQTLPYASSGDQGLYIQHIPPSYTGHTALPVVFDLHGWSEPAAIQVLASGWGAYGTTHHFITITPEVTYSVPHWNTTLGSSDLAYLGDLLTTVEHNLCIDQRRVFFSGYSDGAFMTSAVACSLSQRVASVGTVAGITIIPGCHPKRPVPVVAFHGTADPYVAYKGGIGPSALQLPAADGSGKTLAQEGAKGTIGGLPSIPLSTKAWAKRNGCSPTPSMSKVANGVTLISYSCPHNASVELYRITNGGHAWPGSTFTRSIAKVVGFTTFAISANAIMWNFFQHHPLP